MSVSRSVQFRYANDIIEAYTNNGICSFAITCGTGKNAQMLFVYECDDINEGAEYLAGILDKIRHSAAIYTICLYSKVPTDGIASNTPFRNSFNFQLKQLPNQVGYLENDNSGYNNELLSKVEALTMAVAQLQEEKESQEDIDNKLGLIGAVLDHPVLGTIVKEVTSNLGAALGSFLSNNKTKPVMSGIDNMSDEKKFNDAVAVLRSVDSQFTDNLYKLAVIAQQDPAKYKMLVGMLNAL